MNKLLVFPALFFLILVNSCEKPSDDAIILSDKIRLTAEMQNGHVHLKWNRPYVINFNHYTLLRSTQPFSTYSNPPSYPTSFPSSISRIEQIDSTSFIDTSAPLSNKLYYQIIASGHNSIQSNTVELTTYFNILNISVADALIWEEQDLLLLFDRRQKKVYKYNYQTRELTDSLQLSFEPEFSALGDNGKGMELYIPGDGGVLRIYNANDFSYVDAIDLGSPVSSVVTNNNGLIFCSTSEWLSQPLKSFKRDSKSPVDEDGDWDFTRLKISPTTREIIEITRNIGPVDMDYYKYGNDGSFISHSNDRYHGDHPLDYQIFRLSPDGEYIITSEYGALYNMSLTYLKQVSNYERGFNDFCFDSQSEYIYGGNYKNKSILKYPVSGTSVDPLISWPTLGYPIFLFMLDDEILCIESTNSWSRNSQYYYSDLPTGIVIEKISLN